MEAAETEVVCTKASDSLGRILISINLLPESGCDYVRMYVGFFDYMP